MRNKIVSTLAMVIFCTANVGATLALPTFPPMPTFPQIPKVLCHLTVLNACVESVFIGTSCPNKWVAGHCPAN